jgi:two-component system chemotaxis sensor kinase CheA
VRKKQVRLELAELETLVAGIATLEQIIAAHRDATPGPNTGPLLAQVSSLLAARLGAGSTVENVEIRKSPTATSSEKELRIAEKIGKGAKAWRITFQPSAELVSQGIDVNSIRQRLQALGELVHSEPLVDAGGKIAFAFVLSTQQDGVEEQLHGEGLTWEAYQPASRGSTEPAASAAATSEAELSTHLTPANIVRVDLGRLDELMRMVGELVLSRARLEDGLRRVAASIPAGEFRSLQETNSAIERQRRDLREGVMHF